MDQLCNNMETISQCIFEVLPYNRLKNLIKLIFVKPVNSAMEKIDDSHDKDEFKDYIYSTLESIYNPTKLTAFLSEIISSRKLTTEEVTILEQFVQSPEEFKSTLEKIVSTLEDNAEDFGKICKKIIILCHNIEKDLSGVNFQPILSLFNLFGGVMPINTGKNVPFSLIFSIVDCTPDDCDDDSDEDSDTDDTDVSECSDTDNNNTSECPDTDNEKNSERSDETVDYNSANKFEHSVESPNDAASAIEIKVAEFLSNIKQDLPAFIEQVKRGAPDFVSQVKRDIPTLVTPVKESIHKAERVTPQVIGALKNAFNDIQKIINESAEEVTTPEESTTEPECVPAEEPATEVEATTPEEPAAEVEATTPEEPVAEVEATTPEEPVTEVAPDTAKSEVTE